jgi:hypothetical protein
MYQVAIGFVDDKSKENLRGHNKKSRRTHMIEGYDRFINATVDKLLSVTLVEENH